MTHPDFQHPFGIEDWTDIRARVRKGPDGLWHVMLMRRSHLVSFPGLPFFGFRAAIAHADRVMSAARRILTGA
jgi:hypothetical protein